MTDELIKRPRGRPKGTTKGGETHALTPAQQEDLFRAAHRHGGHYEFLLKLTYALALRVKEAVELKLEDFDPTTQEVLIRGAKEGRHRHYQIPDLWPLYEAWLKRRKAPETNHWVFPSHTNPEGHLTLGGAQGAFMNAARDAGITGHSIHDLRHSCAQDMANGGAPQVTIAAWLRHRSLESSARYVDTTLTNQHQALMIGYRQRRWRRQKPKEEPK